MFKKKKFNKKNIISPENYKSYGDVVWSFFSSKVVVKLFVVVVCVFVVVLVWKWLIQSSHWFVSFVKEGAVKTISKQLWVPMIQDDFGNINILLVWNGGADHAWWFLADTIMVASWNIKSQSVSLISVPRDLFVSVKELSINWKINSVFASAYYRLKDFWDLDDVDEIHKLKMDYASEVLASKLEEITWLEISYFAVINFKEFVKFVDGLWGIEIDVPKRLYDSAYPEGKQYTVFSVDAGLQHFDGETALKYVRSRHSTSDFSRAWRQQQIIKAIVKQITEGVGFSNVSNLKKFYEDYIKMVHTNISMKEIVGLLGNKDDVQNIFSFVFTTECSYRDFSLTPVACFLHVPSRDAFGWSSVILPNWWSVGNVSFYDYTKNFSFFVAHNQEYLKENVRIEVQNWIDAKVARSLWWYPSGHAGNMAVKLKKYAFNIVDINNAEESLKETSVYLSGDLNSQYDTLTMLKMFFDINNVYTWQVLTTGVDMLLILWNDYLEKMWNKKFSFEM